MNDAVWFGVSLALMAVWWLVGYRMGLRAAHRDEYNRIREYLRDSGQTERAADGELLTRGTGPWKKPPA
jgi:hypothetical protein